MRPIGTCPGESGSWLIVPSCPDVQLHTAALVPLFRPVCLARELPVSAVFRCYEDLGTTRLELHSDQYLIISIGGAVNRS